LPIPPDIWEKVCEELGGKSTSDVQGVKEEVLNISE
jgi:hypothetical protein